MGVFDLFQATPTGIYTPVRGTCTVNVRVPQPRSLWDDPKANGAGKQFSAFVLRRGMRGMGGVIGLWDSWGGAA